MANSGKRPHLNKDEAHLMYGYVAPVPKLLMALRKAVFADTCWMIVKKALGHKFPEELLLMGHEELASMDHTLKHWRSAYIFVDIFNEELPLDHARSLKYKCLRSAMRKKVVALKEKEGIKMLTLRDLVDRPGAAQTTRRPDLQSDVFLTTMLHTNLHAPRTRIDLYDSRTTHLDTIPTNDIRDVILRCSSDRHVPLVKHLLNQVDKHNLCDPFQGWSRGGKHTVASMLGLGELFKGWHGDTSCCWDTDLGFDSSAPQFLVLMVDLGN
ncbi:hypothetical protein H2201_006593 [Coniosporium apollinis]|uniref:Uncharacterized protein n=1 Tax=Coniosporium apollinis TaxID=61459 RepID=A0ABQ9NLQ7_9PEZI|nr:hypothetical protein H2201_006593 [Coniosporium apollinis]